MSAFLQGHVAQAMQRVGITRAQFDHLAVSSLGLAKISVEEIGIAQVIPRQLVLFIDGYRLPVGDNRLARAV